MKCRDFDSCEVTQSQVNVQYKTNHLTETLPSYRNLEVRLSVPCFLVFRWGEFYKIQGPEIFFIDNVMRRFLFRDIFSGCDGYVGAENGACYENITTYMCVNYILVPTVL